MSRGDLNMALNVLLLPSLLRSDIPLGSGPGLSGGRLDRMSGGETLVSRFDTP